MLGRNIRAIEAEVPQRRSAASWLGVEEHCQQRRQGRRCHSYGLHAGCRDGRATNGDAAARRCLLGLLLDQAAAAESMHSGRSRGGRRRRRPAGPAAGSRRARPPARRAGRHGTSCWAGDAGWVNRVAVAGIHVVATRYETWLRPRASHAWLPCIRSTEVDLTTILRTRSAELQRCSRLRTMYRSSGGDSCDDASCERAASCEHARLTLNGRRGGLSRGASFVLEDHPPAPCPSYTSTRPPPLWRV